MKCPTNALPPNISDQVAMRLVASMETADRIIPAKLKNREWK